MATTKIGKETGLGDAAVEGLLNGLMAGVAMAGFVLVVEFLAGATPQAVLASFDVTPTASPLTGFFVHFAVAGVYGVLFGLIVMILARTFGARMNRVAWLAIGLLYGAVLLAIAQGIILPHTNSVMHALPLWALVTAHLLFGLTLGLMTNRT